MKGRFRRGHKQAPELDITAFMNLMVILVPFLLITAVFSQVNVVQMNLPAASDKPPQNQEQPPFQLEIVLRKNGLEVGDQPGRRLKSFARVGDSYDVKGLADLLKTLKSRFPDEQAAMLLIEDNVAYEDVIQIMDTVRLYEEKKDGKTVQYELFPEIALGDAPPMNGGQK